MRCASVMALSCWTAQLTGVGAGVAGGWVASVGVVGTGVGELTTGVGLGSGVGVGPGEELRRAAIGDVDATQPAMMEAASATVRPSATPCRRLRSPDRSTTDRRRRHPKR